MKSSEVAAAQAVCRAGVCAAVALALSACFSSSSSPSGPGASFDSGALDVTSLDGNVEPEAGPLPDASAPLDAGTSEAGTTNLGTVWHELEENNSCSGLWTRIGTTSSFSSVWANCNGTTAVMVISIVGTSVTAQRTMDSGGNDCTYTGTLSADALSVTGTYKCVLYQPPPPGAWSATIDYGPADAASEAAITDAPSGG